jgi:hypothetical protein
MDAVQEIQELHPSIFARVHRLYLAQDPHVEASICRDNFGGGFEYGESNTVALHNADHELHKILAPGGHAISGSMLNGNGSVAKRESAACRRRIGCEHPLTLPSPPLRGGEGENK